MMAGDAVREFIDQIDAIKEGDDVDVMLHSVGGDALTAWKLMSLLRERFKHVGVLVPFMAFSAATLFALGADEIVMHPHASLGPIDPQISLPQPNGQVRQFAYEDVGAFLRFLDSEAKITEQSHLSTIIDKLFSVVDPINVGGAKRASELSSAVGERLLLFHMIGSEDMPRAKQIAENLNKSFFAHGDAVSRTRAKELHLKVKDPDRKVEGLLWDAYLGLEAFMDMRKPFILLQAYLADQSGADAVRPRAPLGIPPNTPPELAQQVWQAVAQQAIQAAGAAGVEVPYDVVNAVIESTRVASEYRTAGRLSAFRSSNGQIQLSAVDTESGWKVVT
jgi:Serine dehydrogenase proteinase